MIVYVAENGEYESRITVGVFTTREAADRAGDAVQAYRLDDPEGWLGYDESQWPVE